MHIDSDMQPLRVVAHSMKWDWLYMCVLTDFWTTRCERCPAALDHLNKMAVDLGENAPVVFASMNCDDADFAKELIEEKYVYTCTHVPSGPILMHKLFKC